MTRSGTRDGSADAGARSPTSPPGGGVRHKHRGSALPFWAGATESRQRVRLAPLMQRVAPSYTDWAGTRLRFEPGGSNQPSGAEAEGGK